MILETSIAIGYLAYSLDKIIKSFIAWIVRLKESGEIDINLVMCAKCVSFWLALYFTGDIITASLISLTVFLLDTFIVTKL